MPLTQSLILPVVALSMLSSSAFTCGALAAEAAKAPLFAIHLEVMKDGRAQQDTIEVSGILGSRKDDLQAIRSETTLKILPQYEPRTFHATQLAAPTEQMPIYRAKGRVGMLAGELDLVFIAALLESNQKSLALKTKSLPAVEGSAYKFAISYPIKATLWSQNWGWFEFFVRYTNGKWIVTDSSGREFRSIQTKTNYNGGNPAGLSSFDPIR